MGEPFASRANSGKARRLSWNCPVSTDLTSAWRTGTVQSPSLQSLVASGGTVDSKTHWERVYQSKRSDQVSWFEPQATLSLALIQQAAPDRESTIVDVGGGASTLVDGLLGAGYQHITVLDLSVVALAQARQRLG